MERAAPAPLLALEDVSVAFTGPRGPREVLSGLSLHIGEGEVLGVVGESGSGKSVTALAVMRLLGPQGAVTQGAARFAGQDLTRLSEEAMRDIRGRSIAMIFQEPMTSLNPLLTVGFQIGEVLRGKLGLGRAQTRARVTALLGEVGLPDAARRFDDHPGALSGGMRQRVMIAMALACGPRLLLADEPTTALDVTIQAQILDLIQQQRRRSGMAVMLITHDMGVIARMADRVTVMYAGEAVESAPLAELFARPAHPYTRLLMAATPTVRRRAAALPAIPGQMPAPGAMPPGCRFQPRCPVAVDECARVRPGFESVGEGRAARCLRAADMLAGRLI